MYAVTLNLFQSLLFRDAARPKDPFGEGLSPKDTVGASEK